MSPTLARIIPKWLSNLSTWLWRNVRLGRLLRWAILIFASIWLYQNIHKDLPMDGLKTKYGYADAHFIEVDGMQVNYRSVGKGEPIILLHNSNSSMQTWHTWVDTLSKKYRVIVPDLPGAGLTGPHSRGSYSLFMYSGFVDSFARALDLKTFHLAGNGLGAQIGWFYAAEHPEQVKKLILLDIPGLEQQHFSLFDQIAKTPVVNRLYWFLTPASLVRLRLENIYAQDQLVTDSLVNRHFELLRREGNRKAYTDRAAVTENSPPAIDFIKKIDAPTLVMWGAEDALISPQFAYEFHKKLRNAELRIYNNTGHWPQEESPQETASDALAFLNGTF
jgi:pimeloyl-ACP methyl ester carboxylesterase